MSRVSDFEAVGKHRLQRYNYLILFSFIAADDVNRTHDLLITNLIPRYIPINPHEQQ